MNIVMDNLVLIIRIVLQIHALIAYVLHVQEQQVSIVMVLIVWKMKIV
jgi:hypothetical protein